MSTQKSVPRKKEPWWKKSTPGGRVSRTRVAPLSAIPSTKASYQLTAPDINQSVVSDTATASASSAVINLKQTNASNSNNSSNASIPHSVRENRLHKVISDEVSICGSETSISSDKGNRHSDEQDMKKSEARRGRTSRSEKQNSSREHPKARKRSRSRTGYLYCRERSEEATDHKREASPRKRPKSSVHKSIVRKSSEHTQNDRTTQSRSREQGRIRRSRTPSKTRSKARSPIHRKRSRSHTPGRRKRTDNKNQIQIGSSKTIHSNKGTARSKSPLVKKEKIRSQSPTASVTSKSSRASYGEPASKKVRSSNNSVKLAEPDGRKSNERQTAAVSAKNTSIEGSSETLYSVSSIKSESETSAVNQELKNQNIPIPTKERSVKSNTERKPVRESPSNRKSNTERKPVRESPSNRKSNTERKPVRESPPNRKSNTERKPVRESAPYRKSRERSRSSEKRRSARSKSLESKISPNRIRTTPERKMSTVSSKVPKSRTTSKTAGAVASSRNIVSKRIQAKYSGLGGRPAVKPKKLPWNGISLTRVPTVQFDRVITSIVTKQSSGWRSKPPYRPIKPLMMFNVNNALHQLEFQYVKEVLQLKGRRPLQVREHYAYKCKIGLNELESIVRDGALCNGQCHLYTYNPNSKWSANDFKRRTVQMYKYSDPPLEWCSDIWQRHPTNDIISILLVYKVIHGHFKYLSDPGDLTARKFPDLDSIHSLMKDTKPPTSEARYIDFVKYKMNASKILFADEGRNRPRTTCLAGIVLYAPTDISRGFEAKLKDDFYNWKNKFQQNNWCLTGQEQIDYDRKLKRAYDECQRVMNLNARRARRSTSPREPRHRRVRRSMTPVFSPPPQSTPRSHRSTSSYSRMDDNVDSPDIISLSPLSDSQYAPGTERYHHSIPSQSEFLPKPVMQTTTGLKETCSTPLNLHEQTLRDMKLSSISNEQRRKSGAGVTDPVQSTAGWGNEQPAGALNSVKAELKPDIEEKPKTEVKPKPRMKDAEVQVKTSMIISYQSKPVCLSASTQTVPVQPEKVYVNLATENPDEDSPNSDKPVIPNAKKPATPECFPVGKRRPLTGYHLIHGTKPTANNSMNSSKVPTGVPPLDDMEDPANNATLSYSAKDENQNIMLNPNNQCEGNECNEENSNAEDWKSTEAPGPVLKQYMNKFLRIRMHRSLSDRFKGVKQTSRPEDDEAILNECEQASIVQAKRTGQQVNMNTKIEAVISNRGGNANNKKKAVIRPTMGVQPMSNTNSAITVLPKP